LNFETIVLVFKHEVDDDAHVNTSWLRVLITSVIIKRNFILKSNIGREYYLRFLYSSKLSSIDQLVLIQYGRKINSLL
jgi:hypothetical protein